MAVLVAAFSIGAIAAGFLVGFANGTSFSVIGAIGGGGLAVIAAHWANRQFRDSANMRPHKETPRATVPTAGASPPQVDARLGEMSSEEYFYAAYVDREAGILRDLGWQLLPRKSFVVAIDVAGLDRISSTSGNDARERFLAVFGRLGSHVGGSLVNFAHTKQADFVAEYCAESDSVAPLVEFIARLAAPGKCTPAAGELTASLLASPQSPKQMRVTIDLGLDEASSTEALTAILRRMESAMQGRPLAPPQQYQSA